MLNILYLVHRLPYPPNKGDKIRSYHLLCYLLQQGRVFLGSFVDVPEDEEYIPSLASLCPDFCIEPLSTTRSKLRSLFALGSSVPLSVAYYHSNKLRAWISSVVQQHNIDVCVIFSSAMAPYAQLLPGGVPLLVDFVDMDSYKWRQYADTRSPPWSWLYRREARTLLAHERQVASGAYHSFFVTKNELDLFLRFAPECRSNVAVVSNGVNAEFFAPLPGRLNPFPIGQKSLVFTGAMDYFPNIDAVTWFVNDVLPILLRDWPNIHFYIVGRNPTAEVKGLAGVAVTVTGAVDDVRPFLQYASAVVAPLRVARGIQNKILEAMAMARVVVTVPDCAAAIGADTRQGLLCADTPDLYKSALLFLWKESRTCDDLGACARQYVLNNYTWDAHMKKIGEFLPVAAGCRG